MSSSVQTVTISNPVLPKGSWVLVTGANGFIASHICDQLLAFGFNVRGTVRSIPKNEWMNHLFSSRHTSAKFELICVPNINAEGAFDEAVKGMHGIAHTSHSMDLNPDPNISVTGTIDQTLSILNAASTKPNVKRFVLLSSCAAACKASPDAVETITTASWNKDEVQKAWDPDYKDPSMPGLAACGASKTQGEQAALRWVEENKASFVLNTVCPNANVGLILDPKQQRSPSSDAWTKGLWSGNSGYWEYLSCPGYYIDVQDMARLFVAAMAHSKVTGERIFPFAHPFNCNDVLASLRKAHPDRKFMDDVVPDPPRDKSVIMPRERAEKLLMEIGFPGWTSLEDGVRMQTKAFLERD